MDSVYAERSGGVTPVDVWKKMLQHGRQLRSNADRLQTLDLKQLLKQLQRLIVEHIALRTLQQLHVMPHR